MCVIFENISVADLRGVPGMRAPPGGPNSFIFMQFLAEKISTPTLGVGTPLGKILDPPLYFVSNINTTKN